MPRIIRTFNTRRGYSAKGQRIAWCCERQPYCDVRGIIYLVTFMDVDRGISGTMLFLGKEPDQDGVLASYDHCNYSGGPLRDAHLETELRTAAEEL